MLAVSPVPAGDLPNLAAPQHHAQHHFMLPVNCLQSPEMLQGCAEVQEREVVQAWGKTGQGTWLMLFCSIPLMCLYMRVLLLDEIFLCEVLCL